MSDFSQERLDQIWDKGAIIRGKNPDLYRKDIYGNTMYKPSYGKTSEMGWNVDHSRVRNTKFPKNSAHIVLQHDKEPFKRLASCTTAVAFYYNVVICFLLFFVWHILCLNKIAYNALRVLVGRMFN